MTTFERKHTHRVGENKIWSPLPLHQFIKCFTKDEKCQANAVIYMLFTFAQSHLISVRKCSHHVLFWRYKFCLLEHSLLFKEGCRQEASHFNPLLALPNAKHLCSAFSKSIGTQDISQWISDCSEQNIKHAFCFSKAGFQNRTGNKSKLKVYENRQL